MPLTSQWSWKAYTSGARLKQEYLDSDQTRYWISGLVSTPYGYVEVYSQNGRNQSTYRFIHNGREYFAYENRTRTKRGLTIMANRYARQIATRRAR